MIDVSKAVEIIAECARDFGSESIGIDKAVGRILAEDWYADRDFPPFDRIMMDGIAIQYESFESGQREYKIESLSAAGSPQGKLLDPGSCIEVMTGCILPKATDTVIRYEDIVIHNQLAIINHDVNVNHFQNIHSQGRDKKRGDLLVKSAHLISAAEIGIAASIGKEHIEVRKAPSVIVISTGDELVGIGEEPEIHQIRKSNVYQLKASIESWGIKVDIDHLNDDLGIITNRLVDHLINYDVIIFSGGVSKGKFDFIPEALNRLGVEKCFHKVLQRPGKPFWFGRNEQCTIFAFPGNPISSFLCLHKYFKHWLNLCLGVKNRRSIFAILGDNVNFKPDLTYFLGVKLEQGNNAEIIAQPIKGNGSGDLANLVNIDGFLELTRGLDFYPKGTKYKFIKFR